MPTSGSTASNMPNPEEVPTSDAEMLDTGGTQTQAPERDAMADELDTLGFREERIRRLAYELALHRNFAPGGELDDWLEAQQIIDAMDRDEDGVKRRHD